MAAIACVIACTFASGLVPAASRAATVPLTISIEGNHFVNGAGQAIRLLGVDHPSSEYACVDGFGYNDGHQDAADATAIASWNATAVRVPLNEDCWLGINGQPNSSQGPPQPLTAAGYRQSVQDYVAALNAHGLYAILDLHWSAPGAMVANSQEPMPDADHSVAFWQSVAQTFASDRAVVFDVFNEPFDPTDPKSGDDPDPQDQVTWACWANGGCSTAAYTDNGNGTVRTATKYQVAGMQTLVNAIRGAGATQPVMVGGLDYANDLTQWATHAPDDPLNQEAASFHNYMGKNCDNAACWDAQIAPIAANVPIVTGEFDEDNYRESQCANHAPSTFDADYMTWADQHGVSYLAWGWWVLSQAEKDAAGCSAFYLLDAWDGTAAPPNGTALHDHLLSLPVGGLATGPPPPPPPTSPTTGGKPPVRLRAFSAAVRSGAASVAFTLRSIQSCSGSLSGQTVSRYALPTRRSKRHRVSLGSVRFSLKAGTTRRVILKLSRPSRTLLASGRRVKVQITITVAGAGTRRTIIRRTLTLAAPRARGHR
jgi:endoglucanase